MAVHIQQFNGSDEAYAQDASVPAGMSDGAYLDVKAASHERNGWQVARSPGRLLAVKTRWGGIVCRRIFEAK